jgi:hypothetical protein
MSGSFILWGYRPDGSARVFRLNPGDELPPGWSDNVHVIQDFTLKTGERLSEAAGDSVKKPIPVSHASARAVDEEPPEPTLQYDKHNAPVTAPVKRKIR